MEKSFPSFPYPSPNPSLKGRGIGEQALKRFSRTVNQHPLPLNIF
jgi:hypothetical protein